jgi:hypothetical protein
LTALKRSRPNCRMWWRCWHKTISSTASDHGNPAGIPVSMQKGTVLKGMVVNRNLSYSRGISGTFGSTSYFGIVHIQLFWGSVILAVLPDYPHSFDMITPYLWTQQ